MTVRSNRGDGQVKYTICRYINEKYDSEVTEDIVGWCKSANVTITGKHDSLVTNKALQGHPVLEGFAGPMGRGGEDGIRYEDWKSHEFFGR
jgi:hypothetical protein